MADEKLDIKIDIKNLFKKENIPLANGIDIAALNRKLEAKIDVFKRQIEGKPITPAAFSTLLSDIDRKLKSLLNKMEEPTTHRAFLLYGKRLGGLPPYQSIVAYLSNLKAGISKVTKRLPARPRGGQKNNKFSLRSYQSHFRDNLAIIFKEASGEEPTSAGNGAFDKFGDAVLRYIAEPPPGQKKMFEAGKIDFAKRTSRSRNKSDNKSSKKII